ncbi:hypothetical protein Ciccas_000528 [Cichlidogyrus casuarinus]|uniref:Uncharacterized protein n=1 Tax=Cichlidogyrus casuarinus TaxID=1844966 RepID=A0ABD2QNR2_9PLAT
MTPGVRVIDYCLEQYSNSVNLEHDIFRERVPGLWAIRPRPSHLIRTVGNMGFSIHDQEGEDFYIYRHFFRSLNVYLKAYARDVIFPQELTLLFNFDGTKTEDRKLWPLQCLPLISRAGHNYAYLPFLVGVFFGLQQPNLRIFLQALVRDLVACNFRFQSSFGRTFNIIKIHFCVDAQARANIRGIMQHNSLCDVCAQVPSQPRHLYEFTNQEPHQISDEEFRQRAEWLLQLQRTQTLSGYFKPGIDVPGSNPLERIPSEILSMDAIGFPVDLMHQLWCCGTFSCRF